MANTFALGTFSQAVNPPFPGVVIEQHVIPLSAFAQLNGNASILALLENWEANFAALQQQIEVVTAPAIPLAQLKIHPPVNLPRQVFCSGANYKKHVIDLIIDEGGGPMSENMTTEERRAWATKMMDDRAANGYPYMFTKPVSAITGAYDNIVLPPHAKAPDWELELGVIIGRKARHVTRAEALNYVAGYAIVNDITNRDHVFRRDAVKAMGSDWVAAKSSPTYLPFGPYLVPAAFVPHPQDLRLTLKLNGEIKQDESTADMIFDIARQIEYLSSLVELWPGDVICTGSPAGNGTHYNRFLREGDVVESTITGLGTQRNVCVNEPSKI
ncbi:MAG TPA: fumarylacetoacetate hydrolase family protein [Blastocatellia bacterium]|nr:fumarylacetoacetate hydrolase family protein [Blastocatellia bacterium]